MCACYVRELSWLQARSVCSPSSVPKLKWALPGRTFPVRIFPGDLVLTFFCPLSFIYCHPYSDPSDCPYSPGALGCPQSCLLGPSRAVSPPPATSLLDLPSHARFLSILIEILKVPLNPTVPPGTGPGSDRQGVWMVSGRWSCPEPIQPLSL